MDRILGDATKMAQAYPKVTLAAAAGLIAYSGLATMLPAHISGMFDSSAFRLLVLVAALASTKFYGVVGAILIGLVYIVSLSTLNRYKTFTIANSVGNETDGVTPTGDSSTAIYQSSGPRHTVTLRGHQYESVDPPAVSEPSGVPPVSDGLEPYVGGLLSPINGADSQL